MTPVQVDFGDVQGVVRFGYKRLTEATYALVRVKGLAAAKAWLRTAPVASASLKEPPPSSALQIAFTASGLETLGLPASVIAAFSPEFIGGMTEASRSRRLGDVGANDPSQWEWGGEARVPHLLIMFFAEPGGLDTCVQAVTGSAWNEAFEVLRWLKTADLDGVEPFGFADGLSQPAIDWNQDRDLSAAVIDYTNVSALGEFLLGYRNEYGKYTDRPVIDPDAASADLPPRKMLQEKRTSDATAPISSCASCARTFAASGSSSVNRQAPIRRRPIGWRPCSWAGRRRGSRWCRFRIARSPASDRGPRRFARTSSRSTAIQTAPAVRSARTSDAPILAIRTIPDGRKVSPGSSRISALARTRFGTT